MEILGALSNREMSMTLKEGCVETARRLTSLGMEDMPSQDICLVRDSIALALAIRGFGLQNLKFENGVYLFGMFLRCRFESINLAKIPLYWNYCTSLAKHRRVLNILTFQLHALQQHPNSRAAPK
jgi:hypothetical protein